MAQKKADIINKFLKNLDKATTVEEYKTKIIDFTQSDDYKALSQARNSFYQSMNWLGTSSGLIDDLHQTVLQYVLNKNSDSHATLM